MDDLWIIYGSFMDHLWIIYPCVSPVQDIAFGAGNRFFVQGLGAAGQRPMLFVAGGCQETSKNRLGVTTGYCKSMCILYVYTMDG